METPVQARADPPAAQVDGLTFSQTIVVHAVRF
jgi:hypothetical protein